VLFNVLFLFKGAPGVGRSHIKNSLLTKYPEKFAYPAPRMYSPAT